MLLDTKSRISTFKKSYNWIKLYSLKVYEISVWTLTCMRGGSDGPLRAEKLPDRCRLSISQSRYPLSRLGGCKLNVVIYITVKAFETVCQGLSLHSDTVQVYISDTIWQTKKGIEKVVLFLTKLS